MENVIIKQAMETKILRYIIIDQHLSWKCHISLVSTKMLKKNLKKNCGDYCESSLLFVVQIVADLTAL